MEKIKDILKSTSHRQYALPARPWKQYQEWHENLMLHWKLQPALIEGLLPAGLKLDIYNDNAWISVIAFTVKNLHPRFLPPISFFSNFHEVNLRTYVIRDGIPGIYFFSIEAQKLLPAIMARVFIGLPYIKSTICRRGNIYKSRNNSKKLQLDISYEPQQQIEIKSELDKWLTERHALYQDIGRNLYRVDVHHKEWKLRDVIIQPKMINYPIIKEVLDSLAPDKVQYADKLSVLVWGREKLPEKKS